MTAPGFNRHRTSYETKKDIVTAYEDITNIACLQKPYEENTSSQMSKNHCFKRLYHDIHALMGGWEEI